MSLRTDSFESFSGPTLLEDGEEGPITTAERTFLLERQDRLHPATAGAFAGGAGGIVMIAVADRVLASRPDAYDLVQFVGRLVSNGALTGNGAQGGGFGAAFVVGALVGVAFALVTRHLRKVPALLFWSLIFFPAVWTLLHAFVLPKVAPWLSTSIPYLPAMAGAAAYGVVVTMQLPLRRRRSPLRG